MGHNIQKCAFLAIRGPLGWPINNRTRPILLPSYPLTYINLHIKIWKQSDKDLLSYLENDEVSADADIRTGDTITKYEEQNMDPKSDPCVLIPIHIMLILKMKQLSYTRS